jgi:hypothetical protein
LFEAKSIPKNALQTVAVGSLSWLARDFCVKLAVAIPAKASNGYNSRLGCASNRPWDPLGGVVPPRPICGSQSVINESRVPDKNRGDSFACVTVNTVA